MLTVVRGMMIAGLILAAVGVRAEIALPAIIGDNMVLQRESEVALWGHASANAQVTVTVSWDQQRYSARADGAGRWRLKVKTPEAGGPYEIAFREGAGASSKVSNVLIGEVWLCSGQSNMEMPLKGYKSQPILNSNDIIMEASLPGVRLFHVERAVAATEAEDCTGAWEVSSPAAAVDFSAVAFQFAKKLNEVLGVPVGVIQSAWGGTPIEAWTDKASIAAVPDIQIPFPSEDTPAGRLVSTCLYNGMIAPLAGFGMKGFLWYQGEANRARPEQYAPLMKAMVSGWRKKWDNDQLPFYFVQIAPWPYPTHAATVPYLREAQQKAADIIPLSGMAVSVDVGSMTTIHPPDKTTIAKRLLYLALARTYGMDGIAAEGPRYSGMEVIENKILVKFEHASGGFAFSGDSILSFEIAGADRKFYPAKATIAKDGVLVASDQVTKPVAVRYAFSDRAAGNLYNTAGLPAPPFRTDNWPVQ